MPFAIVQDGTRLHYQVHGPEDAPAMLIGYPWNEGMATIMSGMAAGTAGRDEMIRQNVGLVDAFAERYRIVHMDYPRGLPPTDPAKPGDLRAETVPGEESPEE